MPVELDKSAFSISQEDGKEKAEHQQTQSPESAYSTIQETMGGADSAPNPWGKGHIKLYGLCLVIYLCSTMNGFDGSLMGSINAIPEFQNYYRLGSEGSDTTGILFSIYQVGQVTGALLTWLSDWRGRRFHLVVGCAGVVVGAVFTATAPTLGSFVAARFILSFFSTWSTTSAPLLLVEIAPPLYRGTVAGTYQTLYYMGSIIATFSLYGANLHVSGNLKWRLSLWLQIVCPGIVCILSWLIPESPRWLVSQGRKDEARGWITKYHANGDASHPIVELEMREITLSLRDSNMRSVRDFFDLRPMVNTRARAYRLMLALTMSWFGQFSGNNIASYYLPFMVNNVGISSTSMILLLNAIYAVSGWIFATIGARLHDVFGRRIMLMSSCAGMMVALSLVAATAAEYERSRSVPASSASIAFIFMFGVVFAVGFTPVQTVYPAEVLSNDMRANGMMLSQIASGCAGFVNTFAGPIALKNIRYWFYVFFVFWDLFELAFIYVFYVETKGRTLEQLDAVFDAPNPRRASIRKKTALEILTL